MQTGLSNLLRFMSTSGMERMNKVLEGSRKEYWDFYLEFRRGAGKALTKGDPVYLDRLINKLSDDPRTESYRHCAENLKKWMAKNDFEILANVRPIPWRAGELTVPINPEFSARIDGDRHLIKLYMPKEKLTTSARRAFTYLVDQTHGPEAGKPTILDLRHTGRLLPVLAPTEKVARWVQSEAAAFVVMSKMNNVA
jgi:hypothetical protein